MNFLQIAWRFWKLKKLGYCGLHGRPILPFTTSGGCWECEKEHDAKRDAESFERQKIVEEQVTKILDELKYRFSILSPGEKTCD